MFLPVVLLSLLATTFADATASETKTTLETITSCSERCSGESSLIGPNTVPEEASFHSSRVSVSPNPVVPSNNTFFEGLGIQIFPNHVIAGIAVIAEALIL